MPDLEEIRPPARPAERYCEARPLPPYRFVPGLHPHPRRHPDGHSYEDSARARAHAPWTTAAWRTLGDWLFGVDCFNAFFFWEAHESWEGLWASSPPDSAAANLLQGLIQITAALLKIHLGSLHGAASLSRTGLDKLARCAASAPRLLGLDVRSTATQFTHYFRPLLQRTLPPLDASVPLLLLEGLHHA